MMKRRQLVALAVISMLAAAGLIGYRYLLIDSAPVGLPLVEGCALHLEPCSTNFPQGGKMTIEINPRQPSPTDTLRVTVSFDQVEASAVGVRFKGVDMNMGYLENFVFELQTNHATDAAASFSGNAGVFACSTNLMQWLVLVRVQLGSTRYEVPFSFETR